MSVFIRGCLAAVSFSLVVPFSHAQDESTATLDPMVVTDTRLDSTVSRSPSAVTVITDQELQDRQINQVADALRDVPGLNVVQTGSPGQLTSVFTRGLSSEATQVMIDGQPVNQGLAGLFNFADLTTENIERIEVVRGPQSSLYGPRAGGGVINIITKSGGTTPVTTLSLEGGSFNTFREAATTSGSAGPVDWFASLNNSSTDNDRPNNQYRYTAGTVKLGWQPSELLHLSTLVLYSLADTGNPNTIFDPKPFDNLLTERWLVGPKIDFDPVSWWHHTLSVEIDHERQINDPNDDGFTGPTRALFTRWQVDYQNVIDAADWLKVVSGFFYSRVESSEQRPFVLFGDPVIGDKTENQAGFLQLELHPNKDFTFVASGRADHFSQTGTILTWRLALNYVEPVTGLILHSSAATGFSPATSQDKIFGNNFALDPNRTTGYDFGFEQPLFGHKLSIGATGFYNDESNLIGFDSSFNTFNLGSAITKGVETFVRWSPVKNLDLSINYTYLDAQKTSSADIQQPDGARLARRPRHHLTGAVSYRWCDRLRTGLELEMVSQREELNFGGPNFDIEDYTTLRFTADYEVSKNFHLTARVENLLDEKYSEVYGYPSLGRAFYGGVNLRF